jgi:hypothetical protein
VFEMVGKMPTKACADMNIADGILPTLPSLLRAASLSGKWDGGVV